MRESIDIEKFEALYHSGLSPSDIAKNFGKTTNQMIAWMRGHGYERFSPSQQKIIRQMYEDGASDIDIATTVDRYVGSIAMWRKAKKLPKNTKRIVKKINVDKNIFDELYYKCVPPSEIAKKIGVRHCDLTTWMRSNGYDVVCPKNAQIIREMFFAGASDAEIAQAIGYKKYAVIEWRSANNVLKFGRRVKCH